MINNENKLPIVYVVAGIFQNAKGEILLIQRPKNKPMPGLWEFPGGKLEIGETPENALERELCEEVSLKPITLKPLSFVSHAYDTFHIVLMPYLITEWVGDFSLNEQQQGYMWVAPNEMHPYKLPTASYKVMEFFE